MTLNYQKIWNVMNDLEMVTAKISSAREILDSAIDKLEEHQYDKAGTLLYAADEFLQYYLQEFDTKFKDAWKETVTKLKQQEIDDCMPPWGHSDMEALRYTDKEMDAMCDNAAKQDKVVKWQLPVEEGTDCITGEQEYYITFPDDLLEAANLSPGDDVEWVDRNDGSFLLKKSWSDPYQDEMLAAGYEKVDGVWTLKKVPKTYTEMVAAGYTMTADGFWIKE